MKNNYFKKNYIQLHQIPEIGFDTTSTRDYLIKQLRYLKINYELLKCNAVIAKIIVDETKPFIVYRAEMDGLPIKEKTNLQYQSKNNNMHACGHDFHMAVALEILRKNQEEKFANLIVVFQPAEELGAGAKKVIESGVFKNIKISNCLTFHVHPELENYKIGIKHGVFLATNLAFNFDFKGDYQHSAIAKNTKEDLLTTFQMIVRELEKFKEREEIVNVGVFRIGSLREEVPNSGQLKGTYRTFKKERKEEFKKIIERLSSKYNFTYSFEESCPIVYNDHETVQKILTIDAIEYEILPKYLHTDDFGQYAKISPSVYLTYGIKQFSYAPIHSPLFNINIDENYQIVNKAIKIITVLYLEK